MASCDTCGHVGDDVEEYRTPQGETTQCEACMKRVYEAGPPCALPLPDIDR